LLRDKVPLHDGREGGIELGDKDCAHIFRGKSQSGNGKKWHFMERFKNSTAAPEKCKMAVRFGRKNDFGYE